MPGFIGLPEIMLLALLALILFGPKRLPEMGRGLGKGLREFKESVSGDHPGEHGFDIHKLVVPADRPDAPVEAVTVPSLRPRRPGRAQGRLTMPRFPTGSGTARKLPVDHLEELRSRLIVAGGAVAVGERRRLRLPPADRPAG